TDPWRHPLIGAGQSVSLIGGVPAEELVPAVTGKGDRDRRPREPREEVGRQKGCVAKRFVEQVGQARHQVEGRPRRHRRLMVVGGEHLGHMPGIGRFVKGGIFESDGECPESPASMTRGKRGDGGRVEPPGEKYAKRDVADKLLAYGALQSLPNALYR